MNRNGLRLLLTAALIGVAVLCFIAPGSATATPPPTPTPAVTAAPVAPTSAPREKYYVAFRVTAPAEAQGLTLCGLDGQPLADVRPDADGDAALGPLRPGSYLICRQEQTLGRFLLNENAAVMAATGRLWTDGELLYLAAQTPASLNLRCEVPAPGYYVISLAAEDGTVRDQVISIPADALPELGGAYLRHCLFEGLAPGRYEILQDGRTLARQSISEGAVVLLELALRKPEASAN